MGLFKEKPPRPLEACLAWGDPPTSGHGDGARRMELHVDGDHDTRMSECSKDRTTLGMLDRESLPVESSSRTLRDSGRARGRA